MVKLTWINTLLITFLISCCLADETEVLKQKFVHPYGVAIPKSQWEEAGQSGQVVSLLRKGVTCTQSYYCGSLEGQTTYTFPFSQDIQKVELYSQNQLLKETVFYSSGAPQHEIAYSPTDHTLVKEWYENGTLKSFEKYAGSLLAYGEYYNSTGKCVSKVESGSGVRTMRDTYGTLVSSDTFTEGQVQHVTLHYENGVPKEINPYVGGVVHGIRKTYYPGGEPKTIETWENGKQQGLTTLFVNGDRHQEIPYVKGIRSGKSRIYKDGEVVVQEQVWKNDKLHGPSSTYLEGRTVTDWYYKGRRVSRAYYESLNPPTELS